ncbi:perlucin-like protein isoform X2 [Pecten maximus]|uniref:perlucin-like protein isoform X2 n=1 Tax=Pecten maximus TaxID=6579 RepID=UPI00145906A1|nr:perlucin-like protein isoform X2 [Pecten maximus]
MVYTVRLGLILTSVIVQAIRGCPNGWTAFNDSCYLVSFHKEDWSAASTDCHSYHGYLAEVLDSNENNFLTELVTQYQKHEDYWLGATDIFVEGDWRWNVNGQHLNYTNWQHGEPDNRHSHGEDCLAAHYSSSRVQWRDYACTSKHYFICETRGRWITFG